MQDRADRAEAQAARLAEAKAEFREMCRRDIRLALAIYRARLLALGLVKGEIDKIIGGNVVQLRRVA